MCMQDPIVSCVHCSRIFIEVMQSFWVFHLLPTIAVIKRVGGVVAEWSKAHPC